MAFAAGMMVFPGGRVDPADGDPRLAARSNLVRAEAARRLGGFIDDETALAAHHAAIRELFEEAGILLAAGRTTAPDVLLREREALLAGSRGMADVVEALDLRLDARALTPIARWVTPAAYARRFDARFFAAELPAGGEPTFVGAEVAAHRWTTSDAALDAMAAGEIEMWIPTSSTLQRLRGIRTFDELRVRLALPASGWAAPSLDRLDDSLLRLTCWTAGGAPGRSVDTFLVGRRELVVVNPGDPSPEALAAIVGAAASNGGAARIAAIALSSADPEYSGGADELSERTGAPVFGPPGTQRHLPFPVVELADAGLVPAGDAGLRLSLERPGVAVYVTGPPTRQLGGSTEAR